MRCRKCGTLESRVIDSRPNQEGTQIRRRRECEKCSERWTTYEIEEFVPLLVLKKDGRREPFNRDKLLRGLAKSCEKRPISIEVQESIVDGVVKQLSNSMAKEVPVTRIGELLLARLKEIDAIAYVRFLSVYREFTTPDDFLRELAKVSSGVRP